MNSPWSWRRGINGWILGDERLFHAYDVNDNAACEPGFGLAASCEEPNEGSVLCPDCVTVLLAEPAGRERRLTSPYPLHL